MKFFSFGKTTLNKSYVQNLFLVKIDCTEPPQSMNGDTLHKGCAGAAYTNGNPAREYCENDEGKYLWWQMCCYWNNKTCLPKENALEGKKDQSF